MSHLLQSLGWALLNSLWQMAILWAIYQFVTVYFKNLKASFKATFATSAIIAGFIWFLITFTKTFFSSETSSLLIAGNGLMGEGVLNLINQKVLPITAIIYLAILIIPSWQFARNYRFVQVIRTNGLTKMDIAWRLYVNNTASAMGIVKKVNIWLSDLITSPVTIGYLKPIILIPVAAMNNLTPHQLEAIILHELSHIRRYDYFINLILSFIKAILYFNPFLKLLIKNVEREREFSCDEFVLQFQYRPSEYASALLRLEQNKYKQMMMAAAGKNHDLLHRIETILGMNKRKWNPYKQFTHAALTIATVVLLHFIVALNKNATDNKFYALSNEFSPYYLLNSKESVYPNYFIRSLKANQQKPGLAQPGEEPEFIFDNSIDPVAAPDYSFVSNNEIVIPELAATEERKVKEAVEAAKKIYQESEWKAFEKVNAEVFNSTEKKSLKSLYEQELTKADWKQLEDQVRLSYDNINWSELQEKISVSLAEIKIDSIQNQLTNTLQNLSIAEKTLCENKANAIPDTDFTLSVIKENIEKVKSQIAKIQTIKSKKVIKL